MPLDGADYQPESPELRALRHALAYFTDESKWSRGPVHVRDDEGKLIRQCVGGALCYAFEAVTGSYRVWGEKWLNPLLGLNSTVAWNDRECPDFAALKAHLKTRIEYYTKQRLSQSYLIIIGSGRQVRV